MDKNLVKKSKYAFHFLFRIKLLIPVKTSYNIIVCFFSRSEVIAIVRMSGNSAINVAKLQEQLAEKKTEYNTGSGQNTGSNINSGTSSGGSGSGNSGSGVTGTGGSGTGNFGNGNLGTGVGIGGSGTGQKDQTSAADDGDAVSWDIIIL